MAVREFQRKMKNIKIAIMKLLPGCHYQSDIKEGEKMIDLKGMRVVYGERVYRTLAVRDLCEERPKDETVIEHKIKIKYITVIVLNEDGQVMILEDEAWMFQFLMEARHN